MPKIFAGKTLLKSPDRAVSGSFVERDGQTFYRIEHFDQMRPFFMSLVSHSDHWMFISSNGGLTAGRRDENSALFPYYTDDKITKGIHETGPITLIRAHADDMQYLWEPFSEQYAGVYDITRALYKSTIGNCLMFEEVNHDLSLRWEYSWQFSQQFGFVRRCRIENLGEESRTIDYLDGIRNILPYGISADLQNNRSNLANAYKRCELDRETGVGIFSLSSMIVDKAEPSEALGATVSWQYGVIPDHTLLSTRQVDRFAKGEPLVTETDVKAEPGAYLISGQLQLEPSASGTWHIVADVDRDRTDIVAIRRLITGEDDLSELIIRDVHDGSMELRSLVGKADGLQLTADKMSVARHYSNVLFNIMRGGIFEDDYTVEKQDLIDYFTVVNRHVAGANSPFFEGLESKVNYDALIAHARATGNPDLIRIAYEYLPLSFSRRHGDPSRPWNKFRIDGKNEQGSRDKYYAGNWRDIFQNWEALGLSFPEYVASMITKFVNASTIDGYNPYRINRDGIDWEVIEPDDPWSYIGYWGDHQIIYLLKLLEVLRAHQPGLLRELLSQEHFVYANVPYRIKGYEAIVSNPQDTIDFAHDTESEVSALVGAIGSDGKLVRVDGALLKVNLMEKLLLTLLTKVSNFVPDAGIWMNTQRPEWNDANNALVGNGVSMVTLCYLNRYVTFLNAVFQEQDKYLLTAPVIDLFNDLTDTLEKYRGYLIKGFDNTIRRVFTDELGYSGERYRQAVYDGPVESKEPLEVTRIIAFLEICQQYFEASIQSNLRDDGLYHSYNLIDFGDGSIEIKRLYEMLEGQVAVLSSGVLDASDASKLLDCLKASKIYRDDQYSYMLYPNRDLPGFLEKNNIPDDFAKTSELVQQLIRNEDTTVVKLDSEGVLHFNRDFHNADDLRRGLDGLKAEYHDLVTAEYDALCEVFEQVFHHSAFTGRSGTFYGYEGLGSIYWHMVSKLLLAVQENMAMADIEHPAFGKLIDHYYEIRAGIGAHKAPEVYGSFPFDPYSHTPWHRGAQQPGMTGQVKEDVINRWAEFGVQVSDGCIAFAPRFLNADEYLNGPEVFEFVDLYGESKTISLNPEQLAFTYCQVPMIFERSADKNIEVIMVDGEERIISGSQLPMEISQSIFQRSGVVACVLVKV